MGLSTFMGHIEIRSTEVYSDITADLLKARPTYPNLCAGPDRWLGRTSSPWPTPICSRRLENHLGVGAPDTIEHSWRHTSPGVAAQPECGDVIRQSPP